MPVLGTSEKMWINYEGITNVVHKGKMVGICLLLVLLPFFSFYIVVVEEVNRIELN